MDLDFGVAEYDAAVSLEVFPTWPTSTPSCPRSRRSWNPTGSWCWQPRIARH